MNPEYETDQKAFFEWMFSQSGPMAMCYDIETGPKPDHELIKFFKADEVKKPSPPGEFDPSSIRFGNTTDPKKRAERVARKRREHDVKKLNYARDCADAVSVAFEEFKNEAALHSHLNQIATVSYCAFTRSQVRTLVSVGPENTLVSEFFRVISFLRTNPSGWAISWDGHRFDLPQLINKAWIFRQNTPSIRTQYRKFIDMFIDLRDEWSVGRWKCLGSLRDVSIAFALKNAKSEELSGKDYYKVLQVDREKAMRYAALDVLSLRELTNAILPDLLK